MKTLTGPAGGPPPPPPRSRGAARGCLLGAALAVALVLGLSCVGLLALGVGGGPLVPDGSILVVRTDAEYPETLPFAPFFLADAGPTFGELVAAVERAAEDPRIAGLHLVVGDTRLGWARAGELRDGVLRLGALGKRVTASLEFAGLADYYLASAAERIFLHPRGQLGLFGVSMEVLFYGEFLEKFGIEAQFEAIGPYKTAPEVFTRSGMSPEHRAQLESLGSGVREELAAAVAAARGIGEGPADRLLAEGPWTASRALASGLVDELAYPDEVEDGFGEAPLLPLGDYLASPGRTSGAARVAVVHLDGPILPGESRRDPLVGAVAGAETVAAALARVEADESVDAVVLRVSSPGGADTASDTIWRAAERVGRQKPVIASFGDTAASGGYWAATAARRVVAEPLSITGSIGVFVGKFSIGGLLEQVGVAAEVVSLGGNPEWGSGARPLDEEDLERLREGAAETYRVFLERVAAARGMTTAEVDAVGQGRVFTGRQALAAGLVDEFGGLRRAIRLAAVAAGFGEDAETLVIVLPEPRSLGEAIREAFLSRGLAGRLPFLRALSRGAPLALLPYRPRIG